MAVTQIEGASVARLLERGDEPRDGRKASCTLTLGYAEPGDIERFVCPCGQRWWELPAGGGDLGGADQIISGQGETLAVRWRDPAGEASPRSSGDAGIAFAPEQASHLLAAL